MPLDFGPQQFGKWLVFIGLFVALVGGLIIILERFGLFRLPGNFEFGSKNWKFYFPLASCIVISIILTLIMWLISYFRR